MEKKEGNGEKKGEVRREGFASKTFDLGAGKTLRAVVNDGHACFLYDGGYTKPIARNCARRRKITRYYTENDVPKKYAEAIEWAKAVPVGQR